MKINVAPFRVKEDEKVSLDNRPTHVEPLFPAKADYAAALTEHAERLGALQEKLFAVSAARAAHRSARHGQPPARTARSNT